MKNQITIATFNLFCLYKSTDNINAFVHREGLIYEVIKQEHPDVIAFQEVVPAQLEVLELLFPEYHFYGHGRLENFDGEGLYIAVKKTEFTLCGLDVFWLSPHPYLPASRFEHQSDCPRICVDLLVRHKKTGKMLRFYNIHLDHIDTESRTLGIQTVLQKITSDKDKSPAEIFLLGDFNEEPNGATIKITQEYQDEQLTDITAAIPFSFHAFNTPNAQSKIDYIFASKNVAFHVENVKTWSMQLNNIHLSDHYPISATINLSD